MNCVCGAEVCRREEGPCDHSRVVFFAAYEGDHVTHGAACHGCGKVWDSPAAFERAMAKALR